MYLFRIRPNRQVKSLQIIHVALRTLNYADFSTLVIYLKIYFSEFQTVFTKKKNRQQMTLHRYIYAVR